MEAKTQVPIEQLKKELTDLKKESQEKQQQLMIMRQHCQKLEVELIGIGHSIQTLEKLIAPVKPEKP